MTPTKLREMKSGLFTTKETVDDVIKEFSNCLPAVMVAVNTTLEMIARMMEEEDNEA